jgi:hypothetical protein
MRLFVQFAFLLSACQKKRDHMNFNSLQFAVFLKKFTSETTKNFQILIDAREKHAILKSK